MPNADVGIKCIRGIHLSGLGRVARLVNHNLSRLWPLVGTTSCARSAQMNTPEVHYADLRIMPMWMGNPLQDRGFLLARSA